MLKPEQIPESAWLAMRDYVAERPYGYDFTEALAAALAAWPGMHYRTVEHHCERIILPLPQEKIDVEG